VVLIAGNIGHRSLVALVVRMLVRERNSAAGLAAGAYLVRCKADSLKVDLEEDLEGGPGVGSQVAAFGRHKAVADAVEVVDMMIVGGAWGIVAGGSAVAGTLRIREVLRSRVSL
jgi:hypothetical protein